MTGTPQTAGGWRPYSGIATGSPGYATLRERASRIDLDGVTVMIASIDDLIAMKRAAGRPQDIVDIESLEKARERMRRSQR